VRRAVQLEGGWLTQLAPQFEQDYMAQLRAFLLAQKKAGKEVFPAGGEIFNAFAHTPLERVKVVILGQDPYHGPGQAHGLCFSVRPGVPVPPSLQNIFKEIRDELGYPIPSHGDLTRWADQGVLLLNAVLSVECGRAASHQGKGWETFTDEVINVVNREREGVVFML
jgi:uracil-DNA glycosylase